MTVRVPVIVQDPEDSKFMGASDGASRHRGLPVPGGFSGHPEEQDQPVSEKTQGTEDGLETGRVVITPSVYDES